MTKCRVPVVLGVERGVGTSTVHAKIPFAAVLAMAVGMLLVGGQPFAAADVPGVVSGVAAAALPALARQSLRLISDLTATACPELPPLGVAAGGLSPEEHLRVAIPWVCADPRVVTAQLTAGGKPTAGEVGCDDQCAQLVQRSIAAVHNNLSRFAAPAPATAPKSAPGATRQATPAAWRGGTTGCNPPDPTGSGGCLTGATRHGLEAVGAVFGSWRGGPVIHSTGCWDRHAWNPSSDHSRGKACDFMVTRPGTFARGTELDNGWKLADWLRANAGPLQVKYLIWQDRYWDPSVHDDPGNWGSRYTGAGIYDVRTATGGHYDHVHASFRE